MRRVSIFLALAILVGANGCASLPKIGATATPATLTTVSPGASATSTLAPVGAPSDTATSASSTAEATATATPTPTEATNAAPGATSAFRLIYPAPNLISPGPKDPRRPTESIVFEWNFADGRATNFLRAGECYVLELRFTGRLTKVFRADSWDSCTYPQAVVLGAIGRMTIARPGFRGPSYDGLIGAEKDDYDAQWRLTIVRRTGNVNPTHIQFVPLSPSGVWLSFPVQGG